MWRDTPAVNADRTLNAYVEIPRGDRRKWEFDMATNGRIIDRVVPAELGGYPINYGFVPQTVSYDGDPFDVLVLGAALEGGRLYRVSVLGIMHMDDEKGLDSKVIASTVDARGAPMHRLTRGDRERLGGYFSRYKLHEPGKFSKVTGWGDAQLGWAFVRTTHAFFKGCRTGKTDPCSIATADRPEDARRPLGAYGSADRTQRSVAASPFATGLVPF